MLRRCLPTLAMWLLPLACSSGEATPSSVVDSSSSEVAAETDPADGAVVDSAITLDSSPADSLVDSRIDDALADAPPLEASPDASLEASPDAGSDSGASCKSGTVQEESCGKCGTRSRLCDASKWLDWSGCFGETGACVPGESREVTCGRCGKRTETCNPTCTWDSTTCTGEGACVPGSTETSYGACLDTTKTKTRTCTDACAWSAWGDCL